MRKGAERWKISDVNFTNIIQLLFSHISSCKNISDQYRNYVYGTSFCIKNFVVICWWNRHLAGTKGLSNFKWHLSLIFSYIINLDWSGNTYRNLVMVCLRANLCNNWCIFWLSESTKTPLGFIWYTQGNSFHFIYRSFLESYNFW